jgi:hypothetical protein
MDSPLTPADVDAALDRLVAAGTVTAGQADAVRAELGVTARQRVAGAAPTVEGTDGAVPVDRSGAGRPDRGRDGRPLASVLAEVGGYVGATFVGAAAVAVAGPQWDSLALGGQLALLLVPAVLMLLAAVGVAAAAPGPWTPLEASPAHGPRRRLVSALVLVAAGLGAGAAALVAGDDAEPATAAVTGLLVTGVAYAACRTALLHLGVAFSAMSAVYGVVDLAGWSFAAGGAGVVVLGVAWALAALAGVLAERVLGLVVGAGLAFLGGENIVLDGPDAAGYAVLAAVALAGLGGYLALREVALLAAGALALAVVVPQAAIDYTDGALGAAGALLVCGLSIVAASVVGLRVRKAAPAP